MLNHRCWNTHSVFTTALLAFLLLASQFLYASHQHSVEDLEHHTVQECHFCQAGNHLGQGIVPEEITTSVVFSSWTRTPDTIPGISNVNYPPAQSRAPPLLR